MRGSSPALAGARPERWRHRPAALPPGHRAPAAQRTPAQKSLPHSMLQAGAPARSRSPHRRRAARAVAAAAPPSAAPRRGRPPCWRCWLCTSASCWLWRTGTQWRPTAWGCLVRRVLARAAEKPGSRTRVAGAAWRARRLRPAVLCRAVLCHAALPEGCKLRSRAARTRRLSAGVEGAAGRRRGACPHPPARGVWRAPQRGHGTAAQLPGRHGVGLAESGPKPQPGRCVDAVQHWCAPGQGPGRSLGACVHGNEVGWPRGWGWAELQGRAGLGRSAGCTCLLVCLMALTLRRLRAPLQWSVEASDTCSRWSPSCRQAS